MWAAGESRTPNGSLGRYAIIIASTIFVDGGQNLCFFREQEQFIGIGTHDITPPAASLEFTAVILSFILLNGLRAGASDYSVVEQL